MYMPYTLFDYSQQISTDGFVELKQEKAVLEYTSQNLILIFHLVSMTIVKFVLVTLSYIILKE